MATQASDFLTLLLGRAGVAMNPQTAPIAQMNEQTMSTMKFQELMSRILGGGGGLKMTGDKTTIDLPTNAMSGILGTGNPSSYTPANQGLPSLLDRMGGAAPKIQDASQTGTTGATGQTGGLGQLGGILSALLGGAGAGNPSASPLGNLAGSNLVGLTPQDLTAALQLQQGQETLGLNKIKTYMDVMSQLQPKEQELTAAMQNYMFAKQEGYEGDFASWEKDTRTTYQKDYEAAVASGYEGPFHQWLMDIKKASAANINIGQKLEEKKAFSELEGQLYFDNPKWVSDLDKQMGDIGTLRALSGADDPKAAEAEVKVNFIEDRITGGGGEIIDVNWAEDGRTMVWKVRWPSGDVKEIRYAIRN